MKVHYLFVAAAALLLVSCGKDSQGNGSGGNGLVGWYVSTPVPADEYKSRITELDNEIKRIENSGHSYEFDWLTESECFADDGFFNTYFGTAYESGNLPTSLTFGHTHYDFIHIVNDSVLEYYESCSMYKDGSTGTLGKEKLYTFRFGKVGPLDFGTISYYGTAVNYVYTKEGNKITITQGSEKEVIAVTDGALIPNGMSKMVKYDPTKTY